MVSTLVSSLSRLGGGGVTIRGAASTEDRVEEEKAEEEGEVRSGRGLEGGAAEPRRTGALPPRFSSSRSTGSGGEGDEEEEEEEEGGDEEDGDASDCSTEGGEADDKAG